MYIIYIHTYIIYYNNIFMCDTYICCLISSQISYRSRDSRRKCRRVNNTKWLMGRVHRQPIRRTPRRRSTRVRRRRRRRRRQTRTTYASSWSPRRITQKCCNCWNHFSSKWVRLLCLFGCSLCVCSIGLQWLRTSSAKWCAKWCDICFSFTFARTNRSIHTWIWANARS